MGADYHDRGCSGISRAPSEDESFPKSLGNNKKVKKPLSTSFQNEKKNILEKKGMQAIGPEMMRCNQMHRILLGMKVVK